MLYFNLAERLSARQRFPGGSTQGVNFEWKVSSDSSPAGVFSPDPNGRPKHLFAWVNVGGIMVESEAVGSTTDAATDPNFRDKLGAPPTSPADLTLADFSEDFEGASLDTNIWDNNTGSPVQGGGVLNWSTNGGDEGIQNSQFPQESGDFSALIDFSVVFNVVGGRTGDNGTQFIARGGANPIDIIISIQPGGTVRAKGRCGGGESIDVLSAGDKSGQFLLERVSGTVNVKYDIGAGFVTLRSCVTADVTNRIDMRGFNAGSNGGTASGTYDNLIITGG